MLCSNIDVRHFLDVYNCSLTLPPSLSAKKSKLENKLETNNVYFKKWKGTDILKPLVLNRYSYPLDLTDFTSSRYVRIYKHLFLGE